MQNCIFSFATPLELKMNFVKSSGKTSYACVEKYSMSFLQALVKKDVQ